MWTMAECPQLLLRAWIWVGVWGGGFVLLSSQNLLVTHPSEAILDLLGPHYFVDQNGQGVVQAETLCLATYMPHVCGSCAPPNLTRLLESTMGSVLNVISLQRVPGSLSVPPTTGRWRSDRATPGADGNSASGCSLFWVRPG